jgi:hypothetical protein
MGRTPHATSSDAARARRAGELSRAAAAGMSDRDANADAISDLVADADGDQHTRAD